MGTVITFISLFALCAIFGRDIVDFICKIIGIIFLGGIFGLVGGAFGWVVGSILLSAGILGFFVGAVIGFVIYLVKWLG